ncbi:polyprenyl synthetase family protein [Rothia sp. P7208]|uniref:polyprenyl synthetase family protein n=1 Tax=Rothia sp. P7208 TaxID=3402660 RepID=UPI003AC042A2
MAQNPPTQTITEQVRAEQEAYLQAVEDHMQEFFTSQEQLLHKISTESVELLNAIRRLCSGGKRIRALLSYWGYRGAGATGVSDEIVKAGVAIELFQTAALIHDDIIDRSDTRRGLPSVHRKFEHEHQRQQWLTSSENYGISSAIIAGDLCLSWSEMMFSSIGNKALWGSEARHIFDLMRTEVMAGQYLDIFNEVLPSQGYQQSLQYAHNIIRYKSAKYSCEHPLSLGGALALNISSAETNPLLEQYRSFGLPLGEGYQLRDDVLGVFGEPRETGKPAGDDLKEGKRTVLIALVEKNASPAQWELLNSQLGNPELHDNEITQLRTIITRSGALSEVEKYIENTGDKVFSALESMKVDELTRTALGSIVSKMLHRRS